MPIPRRMPDAKRYDQPDLQPGAGRQSEGDGRQRRRAVPRQQHSDRRLLVREQGNLARVLGGEGIATIVQNEE